MKIWFFIKISKIDKSLTRLEKKTEDIGKESRTVTPGTTDIKRIIKDQKSDRVGGPWPHSPSHKDQLATIHRHPFTPFVKILESEVRLKHPLGHRDRERPIRRVRAAVSLWLYRSSPGWHSATLRRPTCAFGFNFFSGKKRAQGGLLPFQTLMDDSQKESLGE